MRTRLLSTKKEVFLKTPQHPEKSSPQPASARSKAKGSQQASKTSSPQAQALLAGVMLGIADREQDQMLADAGQTLADKLTQEI
jgi:F0F1-type ATP synthase assembly protein I